MKVEMTIILGRPAINRALVRPPQSAAAPARLAKNSKATPFDFQTGAKDQSSSFANYLTALRAPAVKFCNVLHYKQIRNQTFNHAPFHFALDFIVCADGGGC